MLILDDGCMIFCFVYEKNFIIKTKFSACMWKKRKYKCKYPVVKLFKDLKIKTKKVLILVLLYKCIMGNCRTEMRQS